MDEQVYRDGWESEELITRVGSYILPRSYSSLILHRAKDRELWHPMTAYMSQDIVLR